MKILQFQRSLTYVQFSFTRQTNFISLEFLLVGYQYEPRQLIRGCNHRKFLKQLLFHLNFFSVFFNLTKSPWFKPDISAINLLT